MIRFVGLLAGLYLSPSKDKSSINKPSQFPSLSFPLPPPPTPPFAVSDSAGDREQSRQDLTAESSPETMSSGRYMYYSPSPSSASHSPHISGLRSASSALIEQEMYLNELLAEHQKINPFLPVLPNCYRLLNQGKKKCISRRFKDLLEILRVTTLLGNASVLDQTGNEHARPMAPGGLFSNGGMEMNGWPLQYQSEIPSLQPNLSSTPSWLSSHNSDPSGLIVKRTIRVDIPFDKYPNFNFVGRLLGPRGNSLKRVEAATECRVLIRGRGSIKDPTKEEMMRGKPGFEHLNEPLHILVDAELPVEIIDTRLMQAREILEELLKPVDESQDFFKKQQLRELAILNGTLREENAHMSGSVSPFNSLGNNNIKRAKTQGLPSYKYSKLVYILQGKQQQIYKLHFLGNYSTIKFPRQRIFFLIESNPDQQSSIYIQIDDQSTICVVVMPTSVQGDYLLCLLSLWITWHSVRPKLFLCRRRLLLLPRRLHSHQFQPTE
ncbi:LOW QUALITY PROTEIN: hypothetical protein V2J09_001707 [Rumex salicifolius]